MHSTGVFLIRHELRQISRTLTTGRTRAVAVFADRLQLVAHMEAALQREQVRSTPSVHIGPLSICRMERKAAWRGQALALTVREFDILTILAENYGRAVPRDLLLDLLLGVGHAGEARVIDRHVMKLRRKLGDGACQIETVWGIGYRLSCRMGGAYGPSAIESGALP
jgi:DNA-binding response OmpR family regulator